MLYGELGRYPINILCKSRMVGFWQRIINGKHDKIAYRLYKILLSMHQRDLFHSRWLLCIKECLISSGLNDMWNSQDTAHVPQSLNRFGENQFLTQPIVSIIEYLKQTKYLSNIFICSPMI